MGMETRRAIIVGITSDIGSAIAERWLQAGVSLVGSYRTMSNAARALPLNAESLFQCDFDNDESIQRFVSEVGALRVGWSRLVVCPGTMNPIGPFESIEFSDWEAGFRVNFISTLRVIRGLLPFRDCSSGPPIVIVFAGGGVNSAPENFSSYTVSKIALIKMIELMAAEMSDTRFVILGPGWVETKIHRETLESANHAIDAANETRRRLEIGEFVPMNKVVDCVDWLVRQSYAVISGRNFSAAHDRWGTSELQQKLAQNPNMYKLRRYGNDD
jgi:NAD(P)-dependent dehydrogenase (short-subunit alcohol dehydrogenase family)